MIVSCVKVHAAVLSSETSKATLRKEKKHARFDGNGSGWGVGDREGFKGEANDNESV